VGARLSGGAALAPAFERFDPDAGWPTIRPSLLPLLPRHTPPAIRAGAPIQAILGPGLLVGFGIDLGPAFAGVTRDLVDRWRFVGPGPHRIGAPCRDVLLAFSAATPAEVVLDLVEGIAALDPAGLVPTCFHHAAGSVEQLVPETGDRLPPIDADERDRPRYVS